MYECLPFLYDHKLGHLEGFSVVLVLVSLMTNPLLIQLKLLEIFREVNENLRACANSRYQAVFPSPAQSAWTEANATCALGQKEEEDGQNCGLAYFRV